MQTVCPAWLAWRVSGASVSSPQNCSRRGTGVGFCYNTVRYWAAGFPPMLMYINHQLAQANVNELFRKAATVLSFIFVLGLVALIWAPETKDKPRPED